MVSEIAGEIMEQREKKGNSLKLGGGGRSCSC